jgi:hypothetical protein
VPKESSRGQPRRVVTVHVRAPSVAQRTRVPFLQVEASRLCHLFYYAPDRVHVQRLAAAKLAIAPSWKRIRGLWSGRVYYECGFSPAVERSILQC